MHESGKDMARNSERAISTICPDFAKEIFLVSFQILTKCRTCLKTPANSDSILLSDQTHK
jgi:hypothetical protein